MTGNTREEVLLDTFMTLSDTLVEDYDIVDLLQTLVETCETVFDITAAGILLADESGTLEVVASTSEAARLVEVMQLSAEAGPCIECFTTGRTVSVPDIRLAPDEWSRFRSGAVEQGFLSVYAIPLRLRDDVIGALNLLRAETGELNPTDVRAARALSNVATIGIMHERSLREKGIVQNQLQYALDSRVVIEQAKGVLSHVHHISTDQAFDLLRDYARKNQQKLAVTALRVVRLEITL
ncbi:transcriptional regulator [Subtercola sp. Z020]|uniref:GAF and ANTAR domain-containing protein n=1 Tax=Subtercola sp. Z020 TaxID=2080582 RepID=UPI000CE8DFF0|nr:GAF and ANTAR domain-containing protein [Subtercola sp. Z020]PPF77348.1 transcriptional regulator [Subtercola sp. Z020]